MNELEEFKNVCRGIWCNLFGHRWNEYHCYEVVCSRCRVCREWTKEDDFAFEAAKDRAYIGRDK